MMSAELSRLFANVAVRPGGYDPPHADDAVELMDALTDAELALICGVEPGPRVINTVESLRSSCELRKRLADELTELELALPAHQSGYADELRQISGALVDVDE